MAAKTVSTRKTPARRRTTAPARKPTAVKRAKARKKGLAARAARRAGTWVARQHHRRRSGLRARKDAAILRTTHAGCGECDGTGVITKRKKDGSFNGSRSCTAKPAVRKVSRLKVAVEARVGQDRRSGLHGWSCPCGKRCRPQYRTPKDAIAALKQHEKRRHGGQSVGGAWFVQIPAVGTTPPTTKTAVLAAA